MPGVAPPTGRPNPKRALFVSPHLDDAVLSCGGLIHRLGRSGTRVIVVTICAGVPHGEALSPFARALHERWRASSPGVPVDTDPGHWVRVRRREDEAAAGRLGAEVVHLPTLDAIYRRDRVTGAWPYDSDQALFGDVDPSDSETAASIRRQVTRMTEVDPTADVYLPLAVGHHVDHQLARRALESSPLDPGRFVYYEDYPYAASQDAVRRALGAHAASGGQTPEPGQRRTWRPHTILMAAENLAAKVDAVRCHASQISTFWRDEQAMARAVRAFAASRGADDAPGERYWRRV